MTREVMQQALEALDVVKLQYTQNRHIKDAITAIKAALEQPEQEPVAWRDPTNIDPGQGCTYKKERREKWPHIYRQALYTQPPAAQRPWVGLTDDEVSELSLSRRYLVREVEAMLKERNYG